MSASALIPAFITTMIIDNRCGPVPQPPRGVGARAAGARGRARARVRGRRLVGREEFEPPGGLPFDAGGVWRGGRVVPEAAEHAIDQAFDAVGRRDPVLGEFALDDDAAIPRAAADEACGDDAASIVIVAIEGEHDHGALGSADPAGWEDPNGGDGLDGELRGQRAEQLAGGPGHRGGQAGLGRTHASAGTSESGGSAPGEAAWSGAMDVCGASSRSDRSGAAAAGTGVPAASEPNRLCSASSTKYRSTCRKSCALVITP